MNLGGGEDGGRSVERGMRGKGGGGGGGEGEGDNQYSEWCTY